MLDFSYNISPDLQESLTKIDSLRSSILSHVISPKQEIKLRFESHIERIYFTLLLCGYEIHKSEIIRTLTFSSPVILGSPKGATPESDSGRASLARMTITNLKKSLDYISQNWLAIPHTPVQPKHLELIANLAGQTDKDLRGQRSPQKLLDYILAQPEHPVIQAGIIFKQLRGQMTKLLAHLTMLLFFFKNGFDIKGFFVIEKEWFKNKAQFEAMDHQPSTNLTLWLEYFASTVGNSLENLLLQLQSAYPSANLIPASFVDLNDRQKNILTLLDAPGAKITNKKVANTFKVSQITASRDLAKLVQIGLIFPHGKGRSIFYTKV